MTNVDFGSREWVVGTYKSRMVCSATVMLLRRLVKVREEGASPCAFRPTLNGRLSDLARRETNGKGLSYRALQLRLSNYDPAETREGETREGE